MILVPLILKGKREYHKEQIDGGDEGTMLKLAAGTYDNVSSSSRAKCMFKNKRHEEVDAFVTGFDPGDESNGFNGLVGNLRLSCYTESGELHEVAYPANLDLDQRIDATACGKCGGRLDVKHDNVGGKRVVQDISCSACGAHRPVPVLAKHWYNKVFAVMGQEWTSRVYRLKHAFIDRERVGADGKAPRECTISLKDIKRRFERAAVSLD